MKKIETEADLRMAIQILRNQQSAERKMLKEQLQEIVEAVKPMNLLRNTFRQIVSSRELKDSLLNTTVGLTAGHLSKSVFEGLSHNRFKRVLGTGLLMGITNLVSNNPEYVKSLGLSFFKMIRSKLRGNNPEIQDNKVLAQTNGHFPNQDQ